MGNLFVIVLNKEGHAKRLKLEKVDPAQVTEVCGIETQEFSGMSHLVYIFEGALYQSQDYGPDQ